MHQRRKENPAFRGDHRFRWETNSLVNSEGTLTCQNQQNTTTVAIPLTLCCLPVGLIHLHILSSEVKNSVIFISLTVPATNKRPQHNRAPWIFMSQKRTGEEVGNYIKACS